MSGSETCSNQLCQYKDVMPIAQQRYDAQPSTHVVVSTADTQFYVRRDLSEQTRSQMILNPRDAIDAVSQQLIDKPCRFVADGRCAIADFAVMQLLHQPLN